MRIGLLSQWYSPEPGAASVPGVLGRALAARGHDVSVVTGFPNYPTGQLAAGYRIHRRVDERGSDGVKIRRVALYPSHDRSPARRLVNYGSFALSATVSGLEVLREMDAFWVYNSPATVGLPSAAASARGGPPHLMHIMDLWPDSILFSGLADRRTYGLLERALRGWCQWTYRKASAIACSSQTVVGELEDRGVPRDKLHHVPVWTDEQLFYPRPRDEVLAERLGVVDRFTLLYAGSLGDAQGLDGLLDVCTRVSDLEGFQCLIAGSGVTETRLRRKAEQLNLTNTKFLGRWPAADMGALMSVGDLHLVSLNGGPLAAMTIPSKLPAILACGRAVLASAVGEASRIVEEAGVGWTVSPRDLDQFEQAVREAYAVGRSGVTALGQAARRYYDTKLTLAASVDAVEGLLQRMADDRLVKTPPGLAARYGLAS